MLFVSSIYALTLLIVGFFGLTIAHSAEDLRAIALPGLFFGGAVLFSSLYAIKEPRHGLSAASFLGFLAFLTSSASLITSMAQGGFNYSGPEDRTAAHIALASFIYLVIAFRTWKRKRRAQAIKELAQGPDQPNQG